MKEGFLVLATQVPNVNKVSSGLCPHGLPPSACPICSKMGGGGSLRAGERPQKAGEMTYHECVIMGQILRSRALAQKRHAQILENQANAIKNFETILVKLSTSLKNFIVNHSHHLVYKPILITIQVFILPILNIIKFIPKIIQSFQNLKIEIQDKLNAIFGEIKKFIEKKISELISVISSKFKNLFKIFKKKNTDDEDTKIDEDKKIFNLKNILKKIINRKSKEKNDDSKRDK